MNKKYIPTFFILVIITALFTLPVPKISLIYNPESKDVIYIDDNIHPSGTFIFDIPTLSQTEKNNIARRFHEGYPKLVAVMLELRRQNVISSEDLKNIHKYISNYAIDSSLELPHNDKDLIDYLYDNNLINESQYEKIIDLLDD